MKKIALLAVTVFFSVAAFAQTTSTAPLTNQQKIAIGKSQAVDLHKDIKAYKEEKAVVKADVKKGDMTDAKAGVATLAADRAAIKSEAGILKSEGVAHPIKDVKIAAKIGDEKAIRSEAKDIHADKKQLVKDVKADNLNGAKSELAAIKTDKKDMKKDIREARRDGIKHPIRRAVK